MSRKKIRWIILAILVVVLSVSGFFIYKSFFTVKAEDTAPTVQTSTARTGDIILSATGAGKVIASKEASLGFPTTGVLAELNVAVGDEVKTGDVLAQLGDIEELKATIASNKLSLLTAKQALQDLYDNADLVKAQAEQTLLAAQTNLEDMQKTLDAMNYERCLKSTSYTYYADLILAQEALSKAQIDYDKNYAWRAEDDVSRANATIKLAETRETYNSALLNYSYCSEKADDEERAAAEADVKVAQAELAAAERSWEALKEDGLDKDEVTKAEEQVNTEQAKLDESLQALEETTMVAPFDGTVMSIDAEVGDSVDESAIITLADLSTPTLEVYLDESDLSQVKADNTAEVIFDILPDDIFYGKVVRVDPGLVSSSNVQYIYTIVKLNTEGQTSQIPDPLMLGLNATVDVISAQALDVVLVPLEALRDLGNGKYGVFVQENGELTLRMVEVGLQDVTYAEIKSGLKKGEVVSTGLVEFIE